ncbi:hypothetical protein [Cupriavidus basilensis]
MTKERPILFSGAMVRAILDGRKTQTRRVLKQAVGPSLSVGNEDEPGVAELSWLRGQGPGYDVEETIKRVACPYGQPGDRLYVRETWAGLDDYEGIDPGTDALQHRAFYRADHPAGIWSETDPSKEIRWRPSIHMPRALSRIVLEVTAVRVERLQDISYEDAIAEGMFNPGSINDRFPLTGETGEECGRRLRHPQRSFEILWMELNGANGWTANPWVWVVEFEQIPT